MFCKINPCVKGKKMLWWILNNGIHCMENMAGDNVRSGNNGQLEEKCIVMVTRCDDDLAR